MPACTFIIVRRHLIDITNFYITTTFTFLLKSTNALMLVQPILN